MNTHTAILSRIVNKVLHITLNQPSAQNRLNPNMIAELHRAVTQAGDYRSVLLTANGPHFCAGADLHWLKGLSTHTQNETQALADLLSTIALLPKPVIAIAAGHAIGGGAGLLAACDFVIGYPPFTLGFFEVKLGLVPATIAPYVIHRAGICKAKQLFLTAETLTLEQAKQHQLIDYIASDDDEAFLRAEDLIQRFNKHGPNAMAITKQCVHAIASQNSRHQPSAAELLLTISQTDEAQEGICAFLEKRPPSWSQS